MNRGVVVILAAVVVGCGIWFALSKPAMSEKQFSSLMNRAMGHIENRESDNAIKVLEQVLAASPESVSALRNMARAQFIKARVEAYRAAIGYLDRALALDSDSAATQYLMGLALKDSEQYEASIPFFERAVALDPNVAAARYQLASVYETTKQHDKKREQLEATLELEPMHMNAVYGMASEMRRLKDRAGAKEYSDRHQHLKSLFGTQPADIFKRCVHTEPETGLAGDAGVVNELPAISVTWADVTDEVFASADDQAGLTAAVVEVDTEGRPILFVSRPDGNGDLLSMNAEGDFVSTRVFDDGKGRRFTSCAAGDFYVFIPEGSKKTAPRREARNDILLMHNDGIALLERTGDSFVERTTESGLGNVKGKRARWVDYDHNCVLDLLVAGNDGLQLWENNSYVVRILPSSDATAPAKERTLGFVNVTDEVGISMSKPLSDVAFLELDGNVALDIVAAGAEKTDVFMNQRAGQFKAMPSPPGPWPAARRVVVNDLDNDGWTDAVLAGAGGLHLIYGGGERVSVVMSGLLGAVLVDYDNDGWLDLVTYEESGAVKTLRNLTSREWNAADAKTIWAGSVTRELVTGDFDNDGDSDVLVVTEADTLHLLRNDGGNANKQLKLRLQMVLTNPTGIGDHVELRDGATLISRFVTEVPIEIGIGHISQFDTVHALWTNGVVDNEFLVSVPDHPLEFVERLVEVGSCPFLFAWNGERYRFVTDILGNSPLGLSIARDEALPADPDELVFVGTDDDLVADDGAYKLEVAECYREVLYLDEATLIAVDHADDVEVHPTDKLMPPPFPTSELWAVADVRSADSVVSSDGLDRTADLVSIDNVFGEPGEVLPPPFRGMCHPLTLTMDFGALDGLAHPVLVMTGWLRYGSASVNIAIEQNPGIEVIPPTLEVETADGVWQRVDVVVGMPAGKTKTILVDLRGKLPAGTKRLRLTSTFEIRWDRIAVGRRVPLANAAVTKVSPSQAELYFRGFPEMTSRVARGPITPDYQRMSKTPAWRTTPAGFCTRFGDVLELVDRADERIAILNGGDAVTLTYPADALPSLADGKTRSFFFYSVGWEKDADHNVVDGDTVEPLPVDVLDKDGNVKPWHRKYNTRWVPGRAFDPMR